MIYSSEVSGIIANQQGQLAQNANYAGYLSSRYGGGNPYASAGDGGGGAPMQDPRAVGGFFGPPPGQFVYGNPVGSQWERESQLSGASMGLMQGAKEAGALAMGGLMWAGMFNHAFNAFDPFTSVLGAFGSAGAGTFRRAGLATAQQGWWGGAFNAVKKGRFGTLGRSMVSGAAGALPIAAGYYAGYKAATFGVNNLMAGAEEQLAVNSTLLNYGTRMNMPGMAGHQWNYGDMRAMESTVYDVSEQNLWTDPGDINQVLAGGMQAGMFRNVRNTGELQSALKELVGALKDTARTFNTTLSGAIPYLQGARDMGFRDFGAAANVAQMARGLGVPSGTSPETMMGMGRMGMQHALSAGASADQIRSSVLRSMEFAGRVGYANQQGYLSDDRVFEMTGQFGEAGRASLAQQMTGTAQGLLNSRFGRWITMAMMNPTTGEYDSARAGYMGSVGGMLGGARDAMRTRGGIVRWKLHRGRIGQQAISEQGPDVFAGSVLNSIADYTDRMSGGNTEISDLLIERLTGVGQRESHLLRNLANQAPRLKEMTRQAASEELRKVQAEADYRENVNVGAVMRKIERATIERVRRPIREAGASIMMNINQGIQSAVEDIMGVHRYSISPAVSDAYEAMQGGRPEQWDRLQQATAPSFMSGYSADSQGVMQNAIGALVMPGGAPNEFMARTPNYAGISPGLSASLGGGLAWGATVGSVRVGGKEAPRLFNRLLSYPLRGAAGGETLYGGAVGRLVASPLKSAGTWLSGAKAWGAEAQGGGFLRALGGRAAQVAGVAPRAAGWAARVGGATVGRVGQLLANPIVGIGLSVGLGAWEGVSTYRDLQTSTLSSAATLLVRAHGAQVGRVRDYEGEEPYLRAYGIGQTAAGLAWSSATANTLSLGLLGVDAANWTSALPVSQVAGTMASIRSVDLSDLNDNGLGTTVAAAVSDEVRRMGASSSWDDRVAEVGGHLRKVANDVIDRSSAPETVKNTFRSKVNSGDGGTVALAIANKFLPDSVENIFSKAERPMSDSELGDSFKNDLMSRFGARTKVVGQREKIGRGGALYSEDVTETVGASMSEDAMEFVEKHASSINEQMDALLAAGAGEGQAARAWQQWLEKSGEGVDQAVLTEIYRGMTSGFETADGKTMTIQEAVSPTSSRNLTLSKSAFDRQLKLSARAALKPWEEFKSVGPKSSTSTRERMDRALGGTGLSSAIDAFYGSMSTGAKDISSRMDTVIQEYLKNPSGKRGAAMRYLAGVPDIGNRLMAAELAQKNLMDKKGGPRKDAYARSFYMNARLGRYKVNTDDLERRLQSSEEWEELSRKYKGKRLKDEQSRLRWDYYTEQTQAQIGAAQGVDDATREADMGAARDIAAVASGQRNLTPDDVRKSVLSAGKFGAYVPTPRGTAVSKDAGSGIQQFVTALSQMTDSVEKASQYLANAVAGRGGGGGVGTANVVAYPPTAAGVQMSIPGGTP